MTRQELAEQDRTFKQDRKFEQRYARYVTDRHSRLTIYGVDLGVSREWPLRDAYLTLEAVPAGEFAPPGPSAAGPDEPAAWTPAPARRVDTLLTADRRVLLRGAAGSGKTTLGQWLAVSAAQPEPGEGAPAEPAGLVPFVLPLRSLTRAATPLPLPQDFLPAAGCPLAAGQPDGWADRVLAAGRGLLLVDGVDEVPEAERDRTRQWLRDLVTAYPDNRFVVTSRPSAVGDGWLRAEGFAELSLAPMSPRDVARFISRWHAAAQAEPGLEEALLDAVPASQDLARLATNPLMSGLICALHRERRGHLPRGRKALYDAALSMLLERRDRERDVAARGSIDLDEESVRELLQKLAYWLIRNGRAEMDHAEAHDVLGRALKLMPRVAEHGPVESLLRFLLERSGLLREPVPGTVDFLHRTFQDYLGAAEAVEERDFDLLIDNAHLDQWEDVLRMAVAHARARERATLLRGLLARGDADPRRRARFHLLAMACLEHATQLDPEVRTEVEQRAASLIPPRSVDEAEVLADLGPVVLPLLPGPEGLHDDEAHAVALTAARIGGDAALPLLTRYCAELGPRTALPLSGNWHRFDTVEYGERIIRPIMDSDINAFVTVSDREQLDFVRQAGGYHSLMLDGDFTERELTEVQFTDTLTHLSLWNNNRIDDLGFLRRFRRLDRLQLVGCPGVRDVAPLAGTSVTRLVMPAHTAISVRELNALTALRVLLLQGEHGSCDVSALPSGLNNLGLPGSAHHLEAVGRLTELDSLSLHFLAEPPTPAAWRAVAGLDKLRYLCVDQAQLRALSTTGVALPQVTSLQIFPDGIHGQGDGLPAAEVARAFPGINFLNAARPGPGTDLTPLAGPPALRRVDLYQPVQSAEDMHADALGPQVEVSITPRPRE
ncbi:NACHT domain-containing protein [Streptomyces cacaoi]|uniref:ATP-binding protein n=1 Tax=Streptomyces cacaoi TaxID=1898 RepID=A0A4Y3R6E3_STRCI|nr:NACHT domain-containing protein [Streptomyces cacaoi]NNG84291.1 NACHT domain-containing protein [Streptomyces cacaoi]GEB52338.1 ATP-binding protein [Streptomyces cacaoi]